MRSFELRALQLVKEYKSRSNPRRSLQYNINDADVSVKNSAQRNQSRGMLI